MMVITTCSAQGHFILRHEHLFRGGLVSKAHRLCGSLNSRLESNKEEKRRIWSRVQMDMSHRTKCYRLQTSVTFVSQVLSPSANGEFLQPSVVVFSQGLFPPALPNQNRGGQVLDSCPEACRKCEPGQGSYRGYSRIRTRTAPSVVLCS